MPSYNQQTLVNKVRNGNAVAIIVGDQVIGFGQTVGNSVDFGTEQIFAVGSALPQENQQLKISPKITLSSMQLTADGLAAFGLAQTWLEILANTEMDIHLVDNLGNGIITYVSSTAENYSANTAANQPVTEDVSFVSLDVLNGAGESVLNSNSANVFSPTTAPSANFTASASVGVGGLNASASAGFTL